jgi:nitroreductase
MDRRADTRYPIHELLQRRWSPRAFAERPVEPEKLHSLLEAARWAPSTGNEQPWTFLVATKDNMDEYTRLLSCLSDNNQRWASAAPILMISVASLRFARNDQPNRFAFHDVGLAVENLVIQALAMGLYVHQMAGFNPQKARELYGIPDNVEAVAAIALGYLGDAGTLPEDLRERELTPSVRKPMQEFVFGGAWGRTAPCVQGAGVVAAEAPPT